MNRMYTISGRWKNAAWIVLAIAALALSGCGGGGGGAPLISPGLESDFGQSGTPSGVDKIRLTGSAIGGLVQVDVEIAGPTASDDIYSFAFDLVLGDPGLFQYVPGSAEAGTALSISGGQTRQVLVAQNGTRLTIGVSKVGGGAGNGIAAGTKTVVSLGFVALSPGSTTLTIEGSPPHAPAALDSTGAVIPSVTFDTATNLLTAS